MPELNADLPVQTAYVRSSFLHDGDPLRTGVLPIALFGVSSVPGRAVGFHGLLEDGALFFRLPVHALCWREDAPARELSTLALWDCPSAQVSVWTAGHLDGMGVRVFLPGGPVDGRYVTTLDWHGSSYADDPGELGHKCAHLIALADGNYALQPNNRLQWRDPAWVTKPFTTKPTYRTNTRVWKSETAAWRTEDSAAAFYEVWRD